jgi:extradiol dioxygenase family protein
MAIERIRSVAVVVSDEKKAKEWYRDRLGFEVQDEMEHWVVVGPPGSPTGIHLCKAEWNENVTYAMLKDPDGNEFWLMPKAKAD